ncbi:MAG: ribosome biogenesis GTP-binding protein YihA/YsxC [Bacteroidota bacterium]|nr:ribosome biogenesis GTP-binding protein YihA/YsxC [Bacteroidota bacterium]
MIIKTARFVISNSNPSKCPEPIIPEYAFIGRSNVGKSSLINMLTDIKDLAKTSGKPGKTRLINHFLINEKWYLVDLPGIGYAKTSKTDIKSWGKMSEKYLLHRENLMTVFMLVDCRLDPQKIDLDFINFLGENSVPCVICFTKCDKVSKNELSSNINSFRKAMSQTWETLPVMMNSSVISKSGKEDILNYISETNKHFQINSTCF